MEVGCPLIARDVIVLVFIFLNGVKMDARRGRIPFVIAVRLR